MKHPDPRIEEALRNPIEGQLDIFEVLDLVEEGSFNVDTTVDGSSGRGMVGGEIPSQGSDNPLKQNPPDGPSSVAANEKGRE